MTEFIPRAAAPVIKVADVAYVRFARRDLGRAERYFLDFGLLLAIWMLDLAMQLLTAVCYRSTTT